MRIFVVSMVISLACIASCTKANPDFCCVTDQQCAALGADSQRPCEAGQACTNAGSCVAAECQNSGDCTDPNAPVCINQLCVAKCVVDEDCTGAAGAPHCAPDGACVGCVDASQCSGDTNICDADTRSCRGCERDDECASGVCIEADGACAEPASIMYVAEAGTDAGQCTSSSTPCQTIRYALQQATVTRNVVRVTGGMLTIDPATIPITRAVIIDGVSTRLHKPVSNPTFALTASGQVIMEGVTISGPYDGFNLVDPTITVGAGSVLRFDRGTIVQGVVTATSATINLGGMVLQGAVTVSDGTLTADHVQVTQGALVGSNSQVRITSSRFQRSIDGMLRTTGGLVFVENTLFEQSYELADSINITGCAPGSAFRFNTVVNTSGVDSDGQALFCDSSLDVTSNIFAYRSQHPHASTNPCATRYSLYDDVALPSVTGGEGNKVGSITTFFVDLAGKDFHLSPNSPARDAGQPGLDVSQDLEGHVRGATPDIGALEAP